MRPLQDLTDDEIDALLLQLFTGSADTAGPKLHQRQPRSIADLSDDELLRLRSRNHPDKWPNVNQAAYQAAVEELDRRRRQKNSTSP